MHPLVRDLYKRAILIGKDYPHPNGLEYVRIQWKKALRNPENNPTTKITTTTTKTTKSLLQQQQQQEEKEMRKLIGKGRYALREMIGVIQLKKYRTMRRRYGAGMTVDINDETKRILDSCEKFQQKKKR